VSPNTLNDTNPARSRSKEHHHRMKTSHMDQRDPETDPSTFATREAEAVLGSKLLSPGHALIVVAHAGEGSTRLAHRILRLLGFPAPAPMRCSRRTTAAALLAWFEEQLPLGVGFLEHVDALPDALADLLEDLCQDPRLSLIMTADTVAMRAPLPASSATAASVLNTLWRDRYLDRLDLAPLSDAEIRDYLRSFLPTASLDVLQESALVRTAGGSLALAHDLAEDVLSAPADAPRELPRAWSRGYNPSASTLNRVAARFRDQSPDVLRAAVLLHQLGPLAYTTAARLLGPELVNRLEFCSAAVVSRHAEDPIIATSSVVAAGLLMDPRLGSLAEERERVLEDLERLHLAGVHLDEACSLVLARHLLERAPTPPDNLAPLLTRTGMRAARQGWVTEAHSLAARAGGLGQSDQARQVRWHAFLCDGDHLSVLAEAEELSAASGAELGLFDLLRATVAASWLPATPAWLRRQIEGSLTAQEPELALVLSLFLGDTDLNDDVLERLEANARNPSVALNVRLWSLTLCVTRHLGADRLPELERCLQLGRTLRSTVGTGRSPEAVLERDALLMFDVSCGAARVLAGLDPAGVRAIAAARTSEAITFGPSSGRFASASAAALSAVLAVHEGNPAAARLNLETALRLTDRSTFASLNGFLGVLSLELLSGTSAAVCHERLGELMPFMPQHLNRLTTTVRELAESLGPEAGLPSVSARRPGWAALRRAHHDVLEGRFTAQQALEKLPAGALDARLPASAAIAAHLRALAAHDPEALSDASDRLLAVGKYGAARTALLEARTLFLSGRHTARANDCTLRLRTLPGVDVGSAHEPLVQGIPAGLTQREFEVSLLVGEGLTNAQIGERLVLSVRTVESHVLQARTKLRAPRRGDIPARLHQLANAAP
jgi:DNA-binding CsgD family transcriptional regulator